MRKFITAFALTVALGLTFAGQSDAATEQEKNFVDTYKKAFEASDAKTLESLLYTKDADPMALEFYKMMMTSEMGKKIANIELRDLTPDELAKASAVMPSPNGGSAKLPLKATKKLVLKVDTSDGSGTSSSSSESFVAESGGKYVIPVPVTVK